MTIIGQVTAGPGGFTGTLRTLLIDTAVDIVATRDTGPGPHYRVLADGFALGVGWNRRNHATGVDHVSLALAAPEFGPRRLYADLRANGDGFALVWVPAD